MIDLRRLLILNEGLRLRPYHDTVGKLTIGYGRNLTDRGITQHEAMVLLDTDIGLVWSQLSREYPWFGTLDPVRQIAVADLCFNMGLTTLKTFTETLPALARGEYTRAGRLLRNTDWFRQVKSRGPRIVRMIETGELPKELR